VTTPAAQPQSPAWITSAANWLTPRRIRAHAVVLALCLWGVCAVDFATPGIFDRAGNIKFQDFIQFYISARLITQGRTNQLFDQQVAYDEMRAIVDEGGDHPPTRVRLPTVYGPQVGLLFVPLAHLSFPAAARVWAALSVLLYFVCVYIAWRSCPNLSDHSGIVTIAAIAFPPFYHFFVRGQISVLLLACFTAALLAFRAERDFIAGFALGLLVFKPQFLVAIPIVLLLSGTWRALAGTIVSAVAQLALTWIVFGSSVMRAYFDTMLHMSRWIGTAEPGIAAIQMHSLRAFWTLLIPWPQAVLLLYVATSIAVIAIAAATWKSSSTLAVRFSALTLAAVLVNPHLFIYDLLVLVPVFLLLLDWDLSSANHDTPALRVLLYLSFVLPLLGPLSQGTHVQLSVPVFAALLLFLWRCFHSSQVHASS
jgi:Glycosyltransferase family 87